MTTYAEHEAMVLARATSYIACDFRGRGTYRKEPRPTLSGAVLAGEAMIAERDPADPTCKGRPVLVYAWDGIHQVVARTIYPARTPRINDAEPRTGRTTVQGVRIP